MTDSLASSGQQLIEELKLLASSLALIACGIGILLLFVWRGNNIPRQLFGKERLTRVPWDWLEVFLAVLLLLLLFESAVKSAPWSKYRIDNEAFSHYQLGLAGTVVRVPIDGGLAGGLLMLPTALQIDPLERTRLLAIARSNMINSIVFLPIVLLLLFKLIPRFCGARVYQFGLHLNRWRENLTLGAIGWLVVTPVCTALIIIVLMNFWETLWGRSFDHPMHALMNSDSRISTWILVGITTCIIAPLREEILMRGILQPYLNRQPLVCDVLIIFSMIWALVLLMTPGTGPDRGLGMGPLFFIATIAPGYYLFERGTQQWIKEPGAARGIFVTSLIFAAMHAAAWPQPIPLFFFSLGVGFLAYRTRSLIAPITVHALFNLTTIIAQILLHYSHLKLG